MIIRLFGLLVFALVGCQTIPPTEPSSSTVGPILIGPEKPKPVFAKNPTLEKRPVVPQVTKWLAQAKQYLQQDKPNDALIVLQRAVRAAPRDPQVWHQMARANFEIARYDQAIAMAKKSIAFAGSDEELRMKNEIIITESERHR